MIGFMFRDILDRLKGDGMGALIARGAGGAFTVKVLGAAAMFTMHVLLARVLGVAEYGIYVLALTWVTVLSLIANFGMLQTMTRFVAEYRAREQWGLLRGVLRTGYGVTLAVGLVFALAGSATVRLLGDRLSATQAETFWLAFAWLPLFSLLTSFQGTLRGLNRIVPALLPQLLLRPVLVVCLVSGVSLVWGGLTAVHAMAFTLAAALISFGVGWNWAHRALPWQVKEHKAEFRRGYWLRVGGTLLLMTGMNNILRQTDVLMIGSLMGAMESGLYNSAARLVELVTFGNVAVSTAVAHIISGRYASGDREAVRKIVVMASRATFVFALAACVVLFVFGRWVLSLFGPEFAVAYWPLAVLLAGQLALGLTGVANVALVMTGHERNAAQVIGLVMVVNIFLNAMLIPHAGLIGAALSTATSNVLWTALLFFVIRLRLGINSVAFARMPSVVPEGQKG